MFAPFLLKPAASRRFSITLVFLIVSAWVLLFAWQRSPYAELLGHQALGHHHNSFAAHLAPFLLSWLLMIVAMMLPVSLPAILDAQRGSPRNASAVVVGYLIPWLLFGALAFLGDSALHQLTRHGSPLETAAGYIAPSILLVAGVYQLTPIKRGFTERCRSFQHEERANGQEETGMGFSGGLRLGMTCFGSCWLLMLVMFALGNHRLEWMLILGAMMAAERLAPWGHRLAQIIGLTLIVWAAISMAVVL